VVHTRFHSDSDCKETIPHRHSQPNPNWRNSRALDLLSSINTGVKRKLKRVWMLIMGWIPGYGSLMSDFLKITALTSIEV
jgi:hypothetical protein